MIRTTLCFNSCQPEDLREEEDLFIEVRIESDEEPSGDLDPAVWDQHVAALKEKYSVPFADMDPDSSDDEVVGAIWESDEELAFWGGFLYSQETEGEHSIKVEEPKFLHDLRALYTTGDWNLNRATGKWWVKDEFYRGDNSVWRKK